VYVRVLLIKEKVYLGPHSGMNNVKRFEVFFESVLHVIVHGSHPPETRSVFSSSGSVKVDDTVWTVDFIEESY